MKVFFFFDKEKIKPAPGKGCAYHKKRLGKRTVGKTPISPANLSLTVCDDNVWSILLTTSHKEHILSWL